MIFRDTTVPELECEHIDHRCSRNFNGYNTFFYSEEARDKAMREFKIFEDFIDNSNCSEKLESLLCLLYFPLCYRQRGVILPCASLCEEVISSCSDAAERDENLREILNDNGLSNLTELPQFNCSNPKYYTTDDDKICSPGGPPMPPTIPPPTTPPPPPCFSELNNTGKE